MFNGVGKELINGWETENRRKDNYRSQIFKIDRTDRNQSTAGVLTLDILYQKNKEGSVDAGRGSCWVQKLNDLSSGFFSLSHDLLLSLSLSLWNKRQSYVLNVKEEKMGVFRKVESF